MFHALTGCGTKRAWTVWTSFSCPHTGPRLPIHCTKYVDEYAMQTIESFVILLYDRTSTSTDVDKVRYSIQAVREEQQCPAHTTDKCRLQATCSMSWVPGVGISVVRLWFLPQHCPLQLTGGDG